MVKYSHDHAHAIDHDTLVAIKTRVERVHDDISSINLKIAENKADLDKVRDQTVENRIATSTIIAYAAGAGAVVALVISVGLKLIG